MSEPLYIKSIDSKKMILSDDSEWLFWPGMEPPSRWKVGDQVDRKEKEGKFSVTRVINITRQKQEAGVFLDSTSGDIKKSLGSMGSDEKYVNLDKEIKIKRAEGELIWLEDNSKWHMWSHLPYDPGPWEIGDKVIVTQHVAKSKDSKKYQMKNIETGKELMAMFLGYER